MNIENKKKLVGMLLLLATAFIMAALAGCDGGGTPAMKISEEGNAGRMTGTSDDGGPGGNTGLAGSTGGTTDPGTAGTGGEGGDGTTGTGGGGGSTSAGAAGTGGTGGVTTAGSAGTTSQDDGGTDATSEAGHDTGTPEGGSDGNTTNPGPPVLTCDYEGNGVWGCPAAAAGLGVCAGSDGTGGTLCCLTCSIGTSSCKSGLTNDACGAGGQTCSPCGTNKHCEPYPPGYGVYGGVCRANTP